MGINVSDQLLGIQHAMEQQGRDYGFFKKVPFTMLARQELAFLHALVSSQYSGLGKILDLGCFWGGSTYALASGLSRNKEVTDISGLICSYDLFVWDKSQHDFLENKMGFHVGDSFLDYFKQNLAEYLPSIECHPGDLFQYPWGGEDIEICFIDIAKDPKLNDFTVQQFFPNLLVGSTVIQQDYQCPGCFWLLLAMEYFKDYFKLVGDLDRNSRIYMTIKEIPKQMAERFRYDNFSYDEKLDLIKNSLKTISNSSSSQSWLAGQLNLGLFYFWEGEKELARKCFDAAAITFDGDEWFYNIFFNMVKSWTGLPYGNKT